MSYRILRIFIESYGGIVSKQIDWDEHAILALIADGGQGKSSIIGFVESCLTGVIPNEAINLLTGKAKGYMDIVDASKNNLQYRIEISKTKKSDQLKVKSGDFSTGKEGLRKLIGPFAIDPLEVCKKKPEDQITWFKKTFKIDTTALESEYDNIYDTRKIINSRRKDLRGFLIADGASDIDAAARAERYKEVKELGDLPLMLQEANDQNNTRSEKASIIPAKLELKETFLRQAEQALSQQNSNLNEILRLQERIDQLKKDNEQIDSAVEVIKNSVAECDNIISDTEKWLEENPLVDVTVIQKDIDDINDYIRERGQFLIWMDKYNELVEKDKESLSLTKQLKEKDAEIQRHIAQSQSALANIRAYVPAKKDDPKDEQPAIAGESTDEEPKKKEPADDRHGLYWMDKPIAVLSTTEKLTFGFEMQEQLNPDFQLLLLDDFESVGSQGRDQVVRMCQDKGWRVMLAQVDPKQSNLKIVMKNDLNFETEKELKNKADFDDAKD